jgi:hypothetical protein
VNDDRRPGGTATLAEEVKQLGAAPCLRFLEEHRLRGVQYQIDHRAHLLAEQFHGVSPGAGVGLPVDVARIVTGHVGAMILEVE